MTASDRFLRVPAEVLDVLLRRRLSGTQWSILFWVIRRTLGRNRNTTPFSWYRIAAEFAIDRAGVVRAGRRLLPDGVLYLKGDEVGVRGITVLPGLPKSTYGTTAEGEKHD